MKTSIFHRDISSFTLHIMAMAFMLCDHLWATLLSLDFLSNIGRLAFPIFAFLCAEGFRRTGDRKRYMLRMLIFALISEIPFNFFYGGAAIYPFHQNVLFTFLLALCLMAGVEKCAAGAAVCTPHWHWPGRPFWAWRWAPCAWWTTTARAF